MEVQVPDSFSDFEQAETFESDENDWFDEDFADDREDGDGDDFPMYLEYETEAESFADDFYGGFEE